MRKQFRTFFSYASVFGLVLGSAVLLSGCATENPLAKYAHMPASQIYTVGQTSMDKGDYTQAAEAFQALNADYPFTEYSEAANLNLIYAEYQANEPALALAEAYRFLKLYPTSPNAVYAYYMVGVIDFENGRGFIQRHFPYHMSDHDAASYQSAFREFNRVVTGYPNSPYSQDARRRMMYLSNTLAEYQLKTAQFYFVRGAYVAAIHRATEVLEKYPHAPAVKPAMKVLIQSYSALHLNTLASDMQKVYTLNDGHEG